jgi:hypothetical protein
MVLLILILLTVAQAAWMQNRALRWRNNLYVAVYPIDADRSNVAQHYIEQLRREDLDGLREYFSIQAERYRLPVKRPFEFLLGPQITEMPPLPPRHGNFFGVVLWSLRFRWWASQHSPMVAVPPDIRLYLIYHDPQGTPRLAHSTALSKGRIGLVNVFAGADYQKTNQVMIAHELLHTLGATDKYDLETNLPEYPNGYAAPEQTPRYPQATAELMAGRVPISETRADIPAGLEQTLIGAVSALEIRWAAQ